MMRFGQVTCAFSIKLSSVSKLRIISGTLFSFLLFGSTIKSVKTVIQNGLNVGGGISQFSRSYLNAKSLSLSPSLSFWAARLPVMRKEELGPFLRPRRHLRYTARSFFDIRGDGRTDGRGQGTLQWCRPII